MGLFARKGFEHLLRVDGPASPPLLRDGRLFASAPQLHNSATAVDTLSPLPETTLSLSCCNCNKGVIDSRDLMWPQGEFTPFIPHWRHPLSLRIHLQIGRHATQTHKHSWKVPSSSPSHPMCEQALRVLCMVSQQEQRVGFLTRLR